MTFKYDVALSFAGEQRSDVELVAKGLTAANLRVFFDADEKANLWGKDLYTHLSDVYQNQARYCIIFASKEYADKNWPNHERQNAQARALREKGNEYILPVRFDDTEIPGIPHTVGYLDFRNEGAQGICKAFLQKIGAPRSANATDNDMACESSDRALIQSVPMNTIIFPPVAELSWRKESATFVVEPDDNADGPFLDRLRQQRANVIVAFAGNAGVGNIADVEHIVSAGSKRWRLEFRPLQTEFSSTMEMGTTGTTADQFAEIRARRILLDQDKYEHTQDFNKMMREILVQGQQSLLKVEGSEFLSLYQVYRNEPRKFLAIAWITAVTHLKVSRTVESIEFLSLRLKGSILTVSFRGTREKKYSNVAPHAIHIEGNINLS